MGELFTYAYGDNWGDEDGGRGEHEARLVSLEYEKNKSDDQTGNGFVLLVREWRDYDAQVADTFIDALPDSVIDPQASNQAYDGEFTSQKVQKIDQGDRAVTIRQTLTLAETGGSKGEALKATYRRDAETAVDVYYYWGNTVDQYEAALANWDAHSDAETADGVTVTPSPFSVDGDGVGNFTIRVETRQYRDIDTASGTFAGSGQFTSETEFEKVKEWKQLGRDPDSSFRGTTFADGYIKSQSVRVNADDSRDVVTTEREAQENADVRNDFRATQFETDDLLTARNETTREAEVSSISAGTIVTTSSEENDFGRFDNSIRTQVALADEEVQRDEGITAFESNVLLTARNEAARETEPGSQSAGTIRTTSSVENDFGRFDNSLRTRTSTAQASVRNDQTLTAYETDDVLTARNEVAAETEEVSQTQGTIVTTSSELNDFARYDNSVRTRTGVEATDANVYEADSYETRDTDIVRNQTSRAIEVTTQVLGAITETRSRQNDFKLFDNTTSTRTAVAQDDLATNEIRAFEKIETDTSRNQIARETEQLSQTAGQIHTTRSSKNNFGRFDNTLTKRTATSDVTDDNIRVVTAFVDTDIDVTRNQAARASETTSHSAGSIVQTRSSRNDFNLFDNVTNTRTSDDDKDRGQDDTENLFESSSSVKTRHKITQTTGGQSFVAGTIVTSRNELDEFGRYTATEVTRTSKAVSAATTRYIQSASADTEITGNAGQSSALGAPADVTTDTGVVRTNVNTRDAFGRFTTSLQTVTANEQSASATYDSAGGGSTITVKNNQTSGALAADAAALTNETRNSLSLGKQNAFGLHDYTIVKKSLPNFTTSGTLYASHEVKMTTKIRGVTYNVIAHYSYSNSTTTAASYANGANTSGYRTIAGWGGHQTGVTLVRGHVRQGCLVEIEEDAPV